MSDIAALGLSVRSDGVVVASDRLDDFRRSSDEAGRGAEGMGRQSSALSGQLRRLAGIAAAAGGAILAALSFRAILRDAEEYETQLLRVQAIIEATGGAAGRTAEQVEAFSQTLARETLESVSGVMQAQQVLLTFSNVGEDAFERVIRSAADMSAVFGGDLASNTRMLARAIEDPINSLTMLGRMIPEFRGELGDTIRSMAEMGDVAGAQARILETLERRFGGVAQAVPPFSAAVDSLGQSLGNLRRAIAENTGLGEALAVIVNALSDAVQWLADNVDVLGEALRVLTVVMVGLIATQLPAMIGALSTMTGGFSAAAIAAGVYTGALRVLAAVTALAGGPIGIVVGLLAAGAAAAYLYSGRLQDEGGLTSAMDATAEAQQALNAAMGVFYNEATPAAAQGAMDAAQEYRELAASAREAAAAELALAQAEIARLTVRGGAAGAMAGAMDPSARAAAIEQERTAQANLERAQQALAEANLAADRAARAVTGSMSEAMADAAFELEEIVFGVDELGNAITSALDEASGRMGSVSAATGDLADEIDQLQGASINLAESLAGAFAGAIMNARDLGDALQGILQQLGQMFFTQAFTRILGNVFPSVDFGGFRAGGGSVEAGRAYVVGERQPELFVPGRSGTIIPQVPAGQAQQGGGQSVQVFNLTGQPVKQERSRGPDGRSLVRLIIGEELASGGLDAPMGRFGLAPETVNR